MTHRRFCFKICKLGEMTTTSYMHYTIKGLDVPGNPRITAKFRHKMQKILKILDYM